MQKEQVGWFFKINKQQINSRIVKNVEK